jgi:hypothetical protein
MHQAGGLVKDIFDELESELLQDLLRSMIVWVMPGIDFRQLQFFPGIFERAEGSFRTLCPNSASRDGTPLRNPPRWVV